MNNLTPEQIEQNAAAYVAAMNGRPVERKNNDGSWSLEKNPVNTWYMGTVCRRPAPEPEPPKPWDCPDDVPGPVCWVRIENDERLILAVDNTGMVLGSWVGKDGTTSIKWRELERWHYSTDRKTWKPCVKEVK